MTTIRLELEVDSDEELEALRGALLAARASELSEARRRDDRLSFGYGSDSAREAMTDQVAWAGLRHAMLGRVLAALASAAVDPEATGEDT
jgi:hypothetical protein